MPSVLWIDQMFTLSLPRGLRVTFDVLAVDLPAEDRNMSFMPAVLADLDAGTWGIGFVFATLF